MKKAVSLIIAAVVVISLSACAGRENEKILGATDSAAGLESIENVSGNSETETTPNTDEETVKSSDEMPENGGIEPDGEEHARILIAYFTWAENTYVENPEAVDVDATTSASYGGLPLSWRSMISPERPLFHSVRMEEDVSDKA